MWIDEESLFWYGVLGLDWEVGMEDIRPPFDMDLAFSCVKGVLVVRGLMRLCYYLGCGWGL